MDSEKRFVVRKNTLPYVHQWAVIDTVTGNKIGEYKVERLAKQACVMFELPAYQPIKIYGLPDQAKDALSAASKRMARPNGDQPPKPPKHSNKRPIELD